MRKFFLTIALMVSAVGIAPALAHHSFAMFDMDKTITLKAVVKEVHWSNPHIWVDLVVTPEGGASEDWGIEAGATNTLLRQGWKRDSLKIGDKVVVVARPMRNGSKAASLVSFTLEDGRVLTLGSQGARPDE